MVQYIHVYVRVYMYNDMCICIVWYTVYIICVYMCVYVTPISLIGVGKGVGLYNIIIILCVYM